MHKPVLLQEVVTGLRLKDGEVFVDATYGAGGHTKEILRQSPGVQAISIDRDPKVPANITGNFRDIDELLGSTRPDAILLDLGFSSDQLEEGGRGLSFQKNEPLDMRLSATGFTAADVLNSWDESAIEIILKGFGEEKYSRRIAQAIIERRKIKPFERTSDLVEVVTMAIPKGYERGRINPATRTFQALRITVNEELPNLERGLEKAFEVLKTDGRLAVISFHSLEDRIVKNFFRNLAKEERAELINKKPIVATEREIIENPRSRSAKLRIITKL